MEQQVLLDKLSEFLAVEQAGAQLYRVVAERAPDPNLKARYEEFGRETEHHREVLTKVITALGGDPHYVSPTARVAMKRGEDMLCLSLQCDGLSPEELACVDLESVVMAETKDHADWSLLAKLVDGITDDASRATVKAAVDEVEAQEDEHLNWALETLAQMAMESIMNGPAPSPERWQQAWTGPHFDPRTMHPAPIEKRDGLLQPATMPAWGPPPVARALESGARR